MTKKISEPSTEDLLQALNESNAAAQPAAVAAPSDHVILPAGPAKVALFLPFQITATRNRSDRKPLPAWIVYVVEDGRVQSTHYAHSIHGPADTVINVSGEIPGYIPKRLPGTSGASENDQLPGRLDWYLFSTGKLTVFTEARGAAPAAAAKSPAQQVKPLGYVELPEIPRHQFHSPGIPEFIEATADAIAQAHAAKKWSEAAGTASALAAVVATLAEVDKWPVVTSRPLSQPGPGVDTYPDGSAIVAAYDGAESLPPKVRDGYKEALRLLASRALNLNYRTACERGGQQLATLRDSFQLMAR
ncbi:MAG: hypothetical protein M3Z20_00880 [Chloroflexota bacterium]|nr:hypothetical protein [Chloroflexota bacterium]